MAIIAKSSGGSIERKIIPAGLHVARCYGMIEIGTVTETVMGEPKTAHKILIDWELPLEKAVFTEEKGEQPFVFSKEFTLSMHEKSNLRSVLTSWRGKPFSDEEASKFDITKLIGVPCMLNIVHRVSKDGSKTYATLAGVTPLAKGMACPDPITPTRILSFDSWNQEIFMTLPNWLADKITSSKEFTQQFGGALPTSSPVAQPMATPITTVVEDVLPF